ncbi:MAG: hypothetical protein ABSB42_11665 [Tepidisphaeraceae bacterium]|jgi:hypothetical protein
MAAERGDSSLPLLQTAVTNVNRQADGWRIDDALSYSSQSGRTARTPQPIIRFFIHPRRFSYPRVKSPQGLFRKSS